MKTSHLLYVQLVAALLLTRNGWSADETTPPVPTPDRSTSTTVAEETLKVAERSEIAKAIGSLDPAVSGSSGGCDASAGCVSAPASGCGGCCGGQTCCGTWSVLAEAMFLRRSDAGSFPLILNQETGGTLFNANNLEYDHVAVPRLQLLYEDWCCCWGFDIGFFGIDSWSTHGGNNGPFSPILVGPGFDVASTQPGTIYNFGSSTSLYSAEANIRRMCHPCLTLVAGFRWFELSDDLNVVSTALQFRDFYSIDANNHLYGFQLGADAVLLQPSDIFRVDGIFRAGILGNAANQTTYAPFLTNANGFDDRIRVDGDETSYMIELGLRGVVQMTDSLAFVAGYQFLWLDGIALAPEQIAVTDLSTPATATLHTDGELYFHGATVGFQLTY